MHIPTVRKIAPCQLCYELQTGSQTAQFSVVQLPLGISSAAALYGLILSCKQQSGSSRRTMASDRVFVSLLSYILVVLVSSAK